MLSWSFYQTWQRLRQAFKYIILRKMTNKEYSKRDKVFYSNKLLSNYAIMSTRFSYVLIARCGSFLLDSKSLNDPDALCSFLGSITTQTNDLIPDLEARANAAKHRSWRNPGRGLLIPHGYFHPEKRRASGVKSPRKIAGASYHYGTLFI